MEWSDPVLAIQRALAQASAERGIVFTADDVRAMLPGFRGTRLRKINRSTWIVEFPAMPLPDISQWVAGGEGYEVSYFKLPVQIAVGDTAPWVERGLPHVYQTEPGQESLFDTYAPMLFMVGIGIVTAGAGAQIGAAMMGTELAASYPALASIVGNATLQAVINGGDVQAAVTGAVTGGISSGAGGIVASATESATIGAVAGAAANAAISGGDIKQAIAFSLISSGAKGVNVMGDQSEYVMGGMIDPGYNVPVDSGLFPGDILGNDFLSPTSEAVSFDYAFGGSTDSGYSSPGDLETLGVGLPTMTEQSAPVPNARDTMVPGGAGAPMGAGLIADLTGLALAALKVNQAYQASRQPQARGTTVLPSGIVRTPMPNGLLQVSNPATGQSSMVKPEVGTPYVAADGRTIVNNGNGTYTTVFPDGRSVTAGYGAAGSLSAGIPPALLLGGIGLAAFLFLRK